MRSADRPIAVTDICTSVPAPIPKADTIPARRPPSRVLEITYSMSGPGERLRATVATRKTRKGAAFGNENRSLTLQGTWSLFSITLVQFCAPICHDRVQFY